MAYEKFRDASREKLKLEVSYLDLLKKLEPSNKKSRVSTIESEAVVSRIKAIIESDQLFWEELFIRSKMAQFLEIRPDQLSEIINH